LESSDEEWKGFCISNLLEPQLLNHSYDIVVGSCSLPYGPQNVSKLKIGGFAPTQVAFCTARAWEWVTSTANVIFMEKRESN
jgi:hypothetical protein